MMQSLTVTDVPQHGERRGRSARGQGLAAHSRSRTTHRSSPNIIVMPEVDAAEDEQQATPTPAFSQHSTPDDSVGAYLAEMGRYPRLSLQEERKLAEAVTRGDKRARDRLVECNLRLVVRIATKIAARYTNQVNGHLDILDLIQEGNLGLLRATETFDPAKGRFSTHATWWVRQHIIRSIEEQARIIRLPVPTQAQLLKLHRLCQQAEQNGEQDLTAQELARRLSLRIERVKELLAVQYDAASLEVPVQESNRGGPLFLSESLPSPVPQPESVVLASDLRQHLQRLLCTLKPREQQVLALRYGLLDGTGRTLEEVSRAFVISRERTRQIEKQALLQLLQFSIQLRLHDYLEV